MFIHSLSHVPFVLCSLMAPDGGGGGGGEGTAVDDPPQSFKDRFAAAMDDETKTDDKSKADKVEKPKKKSAIEAALEKAEPTKDKTDKTDYDPTEVDKFLQENPETAPKPNWKRARGLIDTQKTLISQLQAGRGELEKKIGDYKEFDTFKTKAEKAEAMEKENKELRDAITAINVEYEPGFRSKFVDGRKKLLDKAVGRAKEYGANIEKFSDALSLNGKARTQALKEALEDVDEIDRPRIIAVLDQVQELDDERHELIKNPQEAWDALQQRQREQSQRASEATRTQKEGAFERVISAIGNDNVTLRTVEGDVERSSEWNSAITDAINKGKSLFLGNGEVKTEDVVLASVLRYHYPALEKMFLDTRKELQDANKRIEDFEKAGPEFRGGKRGEGDKSDKKVSDRFHEAMAAETGDE